MAFNWRRGLGAAFSNAGQALGRSQALMASLKDRREREATRVSERTEDLSRRQQERGEDIGRQQQVRTMGDIDAIRQRMAGASHPDEIREQQGALEAAVPMFTAESFAAGAPVPDPQVARSATAVAEGAPGQIQRAEGEQQVLTAEDISEINARVAKEPGFTQKDAMDELRKRMEWRRTELSEEEQASAAERFGATVDTRETEAARSAREMEILEAREGRAQAGFESLEELRTAQTQAQEQINAERKRVGELTPQGKAVEALINTAGGVMALKPSYLTEERMAGLIDGSIPLSEAINIDPQRGFTYANFLQSQLRAEQDLGELTEEEVAGVTRRTEAIWKTIIKPSLEGETTGEADGDTEDRPRDPSVQAALDANVEKGVAEIQAGNTTIEEVIATMPDEHKEEVRKRILDEVG